MVSNNPIILWYRSRPKQSQDRNSFRRKQNRDSNSFGRIKSTLKHVQYFPPLDRSIYIDRTAIVTSVIHSAIFTRCFPSSSTRASRAFRVMVSPFTSRDKTDSFITWTSSPTSNSSSVICEARSIVTYARVGSLCASRFSFLVSTCLRLFNVRC